MTNCSIQIKQMYAAFGRGNRFLQAKPSETDKCIWHFDEQN